MTSFMPDWTRVSDVELYDHADDPEENVNQAGNEAYKERVVELSKVLRLGWRAAYVPRPGSEEVNRCRAVQSTSWICSAPWLAWLCREPEEDGDVGGGGGAAAP